MDERTLRAGDVEIRYAIRRSVRARRLRLTIRPDASVTVTLPARASEREAARLVADRVEWILKHQAELRKLTQLPSLHQLWDGGHVVVLGEQRLLRVLHTSARQTSVYLRQDELVVEGPALDTESVRAAVQASLRAYARRYLAQRVATLAPIVGKVPARLFFRDQSTRWGSCSPQGNLSLNWRLIMAPPEVVDYVVLHELIHLVEMSHSPRFWRLLAAHAPDHQHHRRWLREHGPRLVV